MKSRVNFLIVAVVAVVITLFIGNVDVSAKKKNSSNGMKGGIVKSAVDNLDPGPGPIPDVAKGKRSTDFSSIDEYKAEISKPALYFSGAYYVGY